MPEPNDIFNEDDIYQIKLEAAELNNSDGEKILYE
jgi:hypothetical protein